MLGGSTQTNRHVVAAALIGRADASRTTPRTSRRTSCRHRCSQTLDELLLDSLDLHRAAVISAVVRVANRTGRCGPRLTPVDVADFLAGTSAPAFGAGVRSGLS